MNAKFSPRYVHDCQELEAIVTSSIENKEVSYYLILNEWDKASHYFKSKVAQLEGFGAQDTVNVIDIFDVPNVLQVIKSCINSSKGTVSTACLNTFPKVPLMVVLHKAFPRVVDYNGSIAAELGL